MLPSDEVFLIVLLHADLLVGLNVGFGEVAEHKSASGQQEPPLSHQTRGDGTHGRSLGGGQLGGGSD